MGTWLFDCVIRTGLFDCVVRTGLFDCVENWTVGLYDDNMPLFIM